MSISCLHTPTDCNGWIVFTQACQYLCMVSDCRAHMSCTWSSFLVLCNVALLQHTDYTHCSWERLAARVAAYACRRAEVCSATARARAACTQSCTRAVASVPCDEQPHWLHEMVVDMCQLTCASCEGNSWRGSMLKRTLHGLLATWTVKLSLSCACK